MLTLLCETFSWSCTIPLLFLMLVYFYLFCFVTTWTLFIYLTWIRYVSILWATHGCMLVNEVMARCCYFARCFLCMWKFTLSWQRSRSYRNQSIDLQSKSRDWFLYHRDLRYERVNAATFEVNMINQSQDITKKQFQGRFKFQLTFATFFFLEVTDIDNFNI